MKKQLPLRIFLILGLSLVSGTACQTNQSVNNSTNQNQTETKVKENPSPNTSTKNNLKVTEEFWKQQLDKALEKRDKPTGERPEGLNTPVELIPNIIKETTKMKEMIAAGFTQPLDFADLADKRAKGEFIELPRATEKYVIDVEGKVEETEFSSFNFEDRAKLLKPDSPKFAILKKLADDFDGSKYDLNTPTDRKQMRIRLLGMLNQETQKILEEIADGYQKKFNRPLLITSLTRSIDYQIGLNAVSANSFKVLGKDSTSPHSSGCSFDIARKHLTAEEQNFIMQKLSDMETNGRIDALTLSGETSGFHVFVYQDGKPPKME